MTLWWIGNAVLLVVVVPVVVVLLGGVLGAARRIVPTVQGIASVARAASKDLDAVEELKTTQSQASKTIGVVASYGESLDVILDDP
jgi:ABC-type methionine transport system permease subunit